MAFESFCPKPASVLQCKVFSFICLCMSDIICDLKYSSGLKKLYSQTFWRYILTRSCKTTWYPLLIIFSFYNCNVMFNMFLLINSHTKIHIKLYDIIISWFWPLPWSSLLFRIVHLILLFLSIFIQFVRSHGPDIISPCFAFHLDSFGYCIKIFQLWFSVQLWPVHACFILCYLPVSRDFSSHMYIQQQICTCTGQKNFMLKYKSIEQGPHDLETLYQKKEIMMVWHGNYL